MRSRFKKQGSIYVPQPSSFWGFKQASGTIYDKSGFANITTQGTVTYNGNRLTTTGGSGVFNTAAGVYGKHPCFSCFIVFKPIDTNGDSDILSMGSGANFTADDYTWYLDTSSGSNGWKFGVAPGGGDYGNQLEVITGAIDNTKKVWAMFGFHSSDSANDGFIFVKVEGSGIVYANFTNNMSAYVPGRSYYLANTAYFAGGTIGADYFNLQYWENQFLFNGDIFNYLCANYVV